MRTMHLQGAPTCMLLTEILSTETCSLSSVDLTADKPAKNEAKENRIVTQDT